LTKHVVIEAKQGVVERRVVEPHPDLRRLDRRPEIGQAEPDAPGHALADVLLLPTQAHRLADRVAEQEPHADAGPGLVDERRREVRMAVREEQAGEHEHVQVLAGAVDQGMPEGVRDGAPVGVQRDHLGLTGDPGAPGVEHLGPEVRLFGP
jgi:hypothetical protein